MGKTMLAAVVFMFAFCFSASATPPTDIIFSFDTGEFDREGRYRAPHGEPERPFYLPDTGVRERETADKAGSD